MPKKIVIFLGGVAAGIAGSAFFFKKYYEKRCDEDVAAIKKEYKEAEGELHKTKEKLTEEISQVNEIGKELTKEKLGIGKKKINTEKTNYGAKFQRGEVDPAEKESPKEDGEDEDYLASKRLNDMRGDPNHVPEVISEDEYGSNPVYEAAEWTLYLGDGVVANENDEMIDDPDYFVGDLINSTGFEQGDEPTMCVRNYEVGMDIMITKAYSSYSDIC